MGVRHRRHAGDVEGNGGAGIVIHVPLTIREANAFVAEHHRHSKEVRGMRFALGCEVDGELVGVALVGRPVARNLDDGYTAELNRLCTRPEAPKGAASFLYARAWRAWRAQGGRRMVTYILDSEKGHSLKGAGWKLIEEGVGGRNWSCTSRPRDWQPVYGQQKLRFEVATPGTPPALGQRGVRSIRVVAA
jgi:hypothetical protein